MKNSYLKDYLCEVRKGLIDCPIQTKMKLLQGLAEEAEDFVQQMPDCSYEDIVEFFGEPEYAARQLLDAVPLEERKAAQKNKWVGFAAVIAILCTIIIQMGILLWSELQAPKNRVREIIYTSQPYYVPDGAIEEGF